MGFRCATCGKYHAALPLDLGFEHPVQLSNIPASEQSRRVRQNLDWCVIDEKEFYVRGVLKIPIVDHPKGESFCYGVWVSLSEKSYTHYIGLGNGIVPAGTRFFGWFCNRIENYPDTLSLKTNVLPQSNGMRPWIVLQPTDHPLYIDQKQGLSMDRVHELVGRYLE